jgi:hypothetical protein
LMKRKTVFETNPQSASTTSPVRRKVANTHTSACILKLLPLLSQRERYNGNRIMATDELDDLRYGIQPFVIGFQCVTVTMAVEVVNDAVMLPGFLVGGWQKDS